MTPQDQYDLNGSRAFRKLKYSNDLELTELVRAFNRESSPFNHFLTCGNLKMAFYRAMELEGLLKKIQQRLNAVMHP